MEKEPYYRYIRAVDKAGNISEFKRKKIKVDKTPPEKPTVALVNWKWKIIRNDTWTTQDVYVSGKTDSSDPTPESNDDFNGIKGSGIDYFEISKDKETWSTWNYSIDSKLYYISKEGIFYRYIRAVDKAGNISKPVKKTIKIDRTAPKITHIKTTQNTDYFGYTYHKVSIFKTTDNFTNTITGYRAHCAMINASTNNPQRNTCYTSNGASTYTAYNRLNYYLKNNKKMTIEGAEDNKIADFKWEPSIESTNSSSYDLTLPTNLGTGVGVQFAFKVCDEAGNCSSITDFEV